jgi:transcription elongation factor Elf1
MSLTEEQIKKYLEYPNACPQCGEEGLLSAGELDEESEIRPVLCEACGYTFREVWTMTSIEDDFEDEFDPNFVEPELPDSAD